jgi:hypothetical protein
MIRLIRAMTCAASLLCAFQVRADDVSGTPVPSKHQLMKDCMAKQKASDAGLPKEQMKKNCRDVTENQRENDKAEKVSGERAETPKQ